MGLDMYLNKKTYVQNWTHTPKEEKNTITIEQGGKVRQDIKPKRITYIEEQIGYWRKANAIHQWFVANVQEGNDDCGEHYVSIEIMERLLGIVEQVLKASKMVEGKITNGYKFGEDGKEIPILEDGKFIENSTIAKELLPSAEGFFFGSTDYDEYYIRDLENTKKILIEALEEGEESSGEFYYHSSW